nr:MAG TPA: hypothetical protein [Crassvirales sp.]
MVIVICYLFNRFGLSVWLITPPLHLVNVVCQI